MIVLGVWLPLHWKDKLKAAAKKEHRTMSNFAKELIREAMKARGIQL